MKGIVTRIEGNKGIIEFDLNADYGPTKGGKGTVLASSEGFRNLPDNPSVGFQLMVYKRLPKKVA